MSHRDASASQQRSTHATALARFQAPSLKRSLWQFSSTFGGYLAFNAAAYVAAGHSAWITVMIALPAAGLLVRLFIIQHDCGHGSYFRSRRSNDWLGRFCSIFTFTPYAFWRRQHANHHACFNNLDHRDRGIDLYSTCATVAEYRALPTVRRLLYRSLRHPILAQIILPPIVFILLYRFSFDAPKTWLRERRSVLLTNVGLGLALTALALFFGVQTTLLVQLPIIAFASIVGVWLFSVQHRFEGAVWERQDSWNQWTASLAGSSYLKLPRLLQWLTGNIGFHHVHHLYPRVPNYRLQECHESQAGFWNVTTVTIRQAFCAPFLVLWDEEHRCMAPFPSLWKDGG
jgi:omega-6 fatty acid desaturase (delta-12 desaturase)